jgi:RND superfamily putative drug exporter
MRLSDALVRRPALVVLPWLAAATLLLPAAVHLEQRLDVSPRVRGSESARLDSILTARFGAPYAEYAVLVATGLGPIDRPVGRERLDSLAARIGRVPGVTRVRTADAVEDSIYVVPASDMVLLVAGLDRLATVDATVRALREATSAFASETPAPLTLRWTGQAALNADLRQASAADARTAERRVLPLSFALLVLSFGGFLAAVVPVLAGAAVVGLALGAAGWLAGVVTLSLMLQSLVSMVGLGLGIDYALLVTARYREALRAGATPRSAAAECVRVAGHTVGLSAAAVAVGFLALLLVPVTELQSVALGGLLAAVTAAAFTTTLLPILLMGVGRRLDRRHREPTRETAPAGERWLRWGRWVTSHPWTALLAAGVPTLLLAAPTLRLRTGLPSGSAWLPRSLESVIALHQLEAAGRDGPLQSVRVLVELPAKAGAFTPAGWSALVRVHQVLATEPLVGDVWSFVRFDDPRPPSRLLLLGVDADIRRNYLAADRGSVLLEAVPRPGTDPARVVELVRRLRSRGALDLSGLPGARVLIGGLPGLRADYDAAVGGHFGRIVLLVLGGTIVVLALGFRSALIPCKAVLLNLLSVGTGFGVMVLVFQDGEALGRLLASVPVVVFCTLFGLSMDYEVFLLARVAEGREAGLDEREAVVRGMAGAGPVITSAALVMVTVFAGFAFADMLVIRMLGVALAVAVLVDATVVRLVLGPALLVLAGRWNWWPGRRA